MKYYFIINPESGRFANDKEGFIERIDKACRLRDIKYEIHYTDGFVKPEKWQKAFLMMKNALCSQ